MKVLVVDDDVVSRMVLMHLVDSSGAFEVIEAEDGEDAWEQLAHGEPPAICFCDLRMPRLSGMDLLRRIKANSALSALPFVLVSSATDRDTVEQAADLGAGYIVKPFQADQVRAHLAALTQAGDDADAEYVPSVGTEPPLATMARLAIDSERLLVYLGGFQGQVLAAGSELPALLAHAELGPVRARIERLHAGCVTLGLHDAAFDLNGLLTGGLDSKTVPLVLAATATSIQLQSEAVKRLREME